MFQELKRVFRQSMAAFRTELGSREPEDQVADLLTAMRKEMVAARADLPLHEEGVRRARLELEREKAEIDQCERRKGQAERIGDAETARIAGEFAARHRERAVVLEQKVRAAVAEHTLRVREVEEMGKRYREADANRFALLAEIRRAGAKSRMQGALDGSDGPFADFSRMQDAVDGTAAYADAVEELNEDLSPATPPPPRPDLDARLRELKRQMGKE